MKRSNYLIAIILTLSLGMFQCDTKEVDEVNPIQFDQKVKFQSTIHFYQQPMALNQANSKDMKKTILSSLGATNIKDMYRFEIEMAHEAVLFNSGKAVKIENGILKIKSKSGHEIFGEYEGYGYFSKDPMDLLLTIRIIGGTGYFAGATGSLTGIGKQHEWNSDVRILELDGIILRGNQAPA